MSGPLIPYIDAPELPLAFLQHLPLLGDLVDPNRPPSIKPFGTLVAIGVYVGSWVTMNRARQRRIDVQKMSDFIFWVVVAGFVISHVFDALTYHPETVKRDPLYLLKVWDGLSSYGGFLGATIGAIAWRAYRKEKITEMVDVTVSAFPIAWIFGRTGCSVVHDHPGALSNAWFAVKYPPQYLQEGFDGRFDLGLIEMVLTIPLAIACTVLWHRKVYRPNGFYVALCLVAYAPVRFFLDFLRVEPGDTIFRGATDHRYAGLTPAQWMSFLALVVGVVYLRKIWGAEYVPNAPREPEPPPEATEDEDDDDDVDDDEEGGESDDDEARDDDERAAVDGEEDADEGAAAPTKDEKASGRKRASGTRGATRRKKRTSKKKR
ncbi:MAG: prolipoprotein diacylglyceryl transferase family protein [Myxococcota bacterium]